MNHIAQSKRNLRAQLIKLFVAVQQGQSLAHIHNTFQEKINPQDKALFHELSLGVLRQWFALKQVTLPLLQKPVTDIHIETALYLGLYQLLCTRIADHAAISETVEAIKQLGFASASSLVNAILRRATRERTGLQQQLQAAHGLPSWLYKRLNKDWPEQAPELVHALKQTAPLTLRVNQRLIGRDAYLAKLVAQGINAHACTLSEVGIVVDQRVHIPDLIGFALGWFSVQDEHAQLCAQLLPDLNHKSVLDACAAPGGKTAHLLEHYSPSHLIALDIETQRLQRISDNLQRLQLLHSSVHIVTGDARTWQAKQPLDCILLDAPCSAIGVLRRHPDIRLLRQSTDIAQTVALQKQILEQLWPQLLTGGYLLYITCSILKAENEQQMDAFFSQHADAQAAELPGNWGITQNYGRQLLPHPNAGDGFYYCLIKKV